MFEVHVEISNRVRLAAAVLAATGWPSEEQQEHPELGVHPHALETRAYVQDYADHPSVQQVERLRNRNLDLAALFSAAVRCEWPTFEPQEALPAPFSDGIWVRALADFYVDTALAAFFWSEHEALWEEAAQTLRQAIPQRQMAQFLTALGGRGTRQAIHVVPNLVYPAFRLVPATNRNSLYLVVPPFHDLESPEIPTYHVDPARLLTETCAAIVAVVVAEHIDDAARKRLLGYAATSLFLEQAGYKSAAMMYAAHGKTEFPEIETLMVTLRGYLAEPDGRELTTVFET